MSSSPLGTCKTSQDRATPEAGCKYGREDQGCQEDADRARNGEHSVNLRRTFNTIVSQSGWSIWPTCFCMFRHHRLPEWLNYLSDSPDQVHRQSQEESEQGQLVVPLLPNYFSILKYSIFKKKHFLLLPKYFPIVKYLILQIFSPPASLRSSTTGAGWGKRALWPSTCSKIWVT